MSSSLHLLVVDWPEEMTFQVALLGMWSQKGIPSHVLIKDLQKRTKCTSSTPVMVDTELESLRFLSASDSNSRNPKSRLLDN